MRRAAVAVAAAGLVRVTVAVLLGVALLLTGGCADVPAPSATGASGLPTVAFDALPDQAKTVLSLIDAGGPFPFDQDGATFNNREGLLPDRPPGYYREYTVATPGEADRGARRIVTGRNGERYWTDDHYANFAEVVGTPATGQGAR